VQALDIRIREEETGCQMPWQVCLEKGALCRWNLADETTLLASRVIVSG
jgi:hypothetical protein